jgi:hypothetical protein
MKEQLNLSGKNLSELINQADMAEVAGILSRSGICTACLYFVREASYINNLTNIKHDNLLANQSVIITIGTSEQMEILPVVCINKSEGTRVIYSVNKQNYLSSPEEINIGIKKCDRYKELMKHVIKARSKSELTVKQIFRLNGRIERLEDEQSGGERSNLSSLSQVKFLSQEDSQWHILRRVPGTNFYKEI